MIACLHRQWRLFEILVSMALVGSGPLGFAAERPNILFAIADDWSWPHAGVYGDSSLATPHFDRVAEKGVLFHNAYAAAPQCSPNRASILTGRQIWQNEEAGSHSSLFPRKFRVYPEILETAGYAIGYTGKAWGPGNWKDSGRDQNPAGPEFNSAKLDPPAEGISDKDYTANFQQFLESVPEGKPFCFWFGCHESHRKYQPGFGAEQGIDPSKLDVPAFLPDDPIIRNDIADYYAEVQWFDTHLGKMLDLLEQRGELDNTLVVVTSDNGMPFPRAKANLYEFGIHMPLAVMWPAQVKSGRVVEDLIGFADFAPTFLEAAGIPSEPAMTGKSFLPLLKGGLEGKVDPTRKFVLSGRERHTHARPDNRGYPARSIRSENYLLIWNMAPELWPAGNDLGEEGFYDIDASPSKAFLSDHQENPTYRKYLDWAVAQRPEFELYDVKKDPACLENLTEKAEFESIRSALQVKLEAVLISQNDPRVTGQWNLFDSYPRFSSMRTFLGGFAEEGKYNPAFQTRN